MGATTTAPTAARCSWEVAMPGFNDHDELEALPASVPAGRSGRTRGPAGRGPGGSGQKSPWPMILLIGGGSVLLLALLVCGGLGFAAWQISRGVSNFANAMRPPETLDE